MDKVIRRATAEDRKNRFESITQIKMAALDVIHTSKKKQAMTIIAGSKPAQLMQNPKWILTGVAAAVIAVVAMTIWHLMGEPGEAFFVLKSLSISGNEDKTRNRNKSVPIEILQSATPKQTILAEDGASMHFVPAGTLTLPESNGSQPEKSLKVNSFYMDETLVTNYQYVAFLNKNLSIIRVERGVVRVEDEIWLLLSKFSEDYEPIVFQKGEFKVNKIEYASLPVMRVTAFGASSYARFYNRRLPTHTEWLRAVEANDSLEELPVHDGDDTRVAASGSSMDGQMHSQTGNKVSRVISSGSKKSPAANNQPNKYGIRRLNKTIEEWGLEVTDATSRDKIREAEFVVLPSTVKRQSWEGFEEVGFRCVREVMIKNK